MKCEKSRHFESIYFLWNIDEVYLNLKYYPRTSAWKYWITIGVIYSESNDLWTFSLRNKRWKITLSEEISIPLMRWENLFKSAVGTRNYESISLAMTRRQDEFDEGFLLSRHTLCHFEQIEISKFTLSLVAMKQTYQLKMIRLRTTDINLLFGITGTRYTCFHKMRNPSYWRHSMTMFSKLFHLSYLISS